MIPVPYLFLFAAFVIGARGRVVPLYNRSRNWKSSCQTCHTGILPVCHFKVESYPPVMTKIAIENGDS